MSIRHLDLFAGIGGFSRAVEWLGGETVAFVEWEAWNRRVLAKHWPEARYFGDITTVTDDDLRSLGHIDLITGGYPCQPFSNAGQRRGAEDDRHLWPEMRRVIDAARPRFVLAENVAGHISMGLDTVLADLEADGYTCGAVVIPASAVNALHRRDRVWIMADAYRERESQPQGTVAHERGRAGDGDSEKAVADPESITDRSADMETNPITDGRETRTVPASRSDARRGNTGATGDGQASRTLDPRADGLPAGLVRRSPARSPEPDRIRQAWADGSWESDLPRVVTDELERRQKLMAAGNAIVPLVAYEILSVMLEDIE